MITFVVVECDCHATALYKYIPAFGTEAPENRSGVKFAFLVASMSSAKSSNKADSDTAPQTIGNYVLDKTLGEGNFATVKLAKHKLTGQEVCMMKDGYGTRAWKPPCTSPDLTFLGGCQNNRQNLHG